MTSPPSATFALASASLLLAQHFLRATSGRTGWRRWRRGLRLPLAGRRRWRAVPLAFRRARRPRRRRRRCLPFCLALALALGSAPMVTPKHRPNKFTHTRFPTDPPRQLRAPPEPTSPLPLPLPSQKPSCWLGRGATGCASCGRARATSEATRPRAGVAAMRLELSAPLSYQRLAFSTQAPERWPQSLQTHHMMRLDLSAGPYLESLTGKRYFVPERAVPISPNAS